MTCFENTFSEWRALTELQNDFLFQIDRKDK